MIRLCICLLVCAFLQAVEFGLYEFNETNNSANKNVDSGIRKEHVKSIVIEKLGQDQSALVFTVILNTEGAKLNDVFTTKMLQKRIAIIVNDKIVTSPVVIVPSFDNFAASYNGEFVEDFRFVFKETFKEL